MSASYNAWGHSTVVDPNGEIIAKAGETEEIIYANLSTISFSHTFVANVVGPSRMQEVRQAIPITTQRR